MKKSGFVFAETIVVVAVLSVGLIVLYTLFSRIYISENRRINYDNTENLYQVYFLKEFLEENNLSNCFYEFESGQMYSKLKTDKDKDDLNEDECNLFPDSSSDLAEFYYALLKELKISDIFITNYDVNYLKNNEALFRFDATLIYYISTLATNKSNEELEELDAYRIIVRFEDKKIASLEIGGEVNYYDVEIEINDATINIENDRVKLGDTLNLRIELTKDNSYVDLLSVANCGGTYDETNQVMTIQNVTQDIKCNILVKRIASNLNEYIISDNETLSNPTLNAAAVSQTVYNNLPQSGEGLTKSNAVVENGLYEVLYTSGYGFNFNQNILKNVTLISNEQPYFQKNDLISTDNLYSKNNIEDSYLALPDNKVLFYRGSVENNYLTFAGKLWRIIGINPDQSIKIILNEGVPSSFNNVINTNDSMYYRNSIAKNILENWYDNNLNEFNAKIEYGKYCNSLNAVIDTINGGTIYSSYDPSLICSDYEEYFIGLLTYDELVFAGGVYGILNNSFYLKTNENNYIMSPAGFNNIDAYVWGLRSEGAIYADSNFNTSKYLRPVINLKPDLEVTGFGNLSFPYEVLE